MTSLLFVLLSASPDGGVVPSSGLSREAVNRVVKKNAADLRACAQRFAGFDAAITMTFVVSPEGQVRDVAVESMNVTDATDLMGCVIEALRRWTFPSPGKQSATVRHYRFLLPPGR